MVKLPSTPASHYDVVIIGGGAAGLYCAWQTAKADPTLKIFLLEKNDRLGKKILISGGGRCNFTNLYADPSRYVTSDPGFSQVALQAYPPQRFIDEVKAAGIAFHEKHLGQLFCDLSSKLIVQMLQQKCSELGVVIRLNAEVQDASFDTQKGLFTITELKNQTVSAKNLVIACGGLSFPKLGVSDLAYRLAKHFGHRIVETQAALVPFDLIKERDFCNSLSGISLPVRIYTKNSADKKITFEEDLLFTHRGLSGPAILQISLHWQAGREVSISLTPRGPLLEKLLQWKKDYPQRQVQSELSREIPQRLAQAWLSRLLAKKEILFAEAKDRDLRRLAEQLQHWVVVPEGTEGYAKAEVTRGGVDTQEIDPQSMESRRQKGLYFLGEALDVTGWLGGYNFQWAWASAFLAAQSLARNSAGRA